MMLEYLKNQLMKIYKKCLQLSNIETKCLIASVLSVGNENIWRYIAAILMFGFAFLSIVRWTIQAERAGCPPWSLLTTALYKAARVLIENIYAGLAFGMLLHGEAIIPTEWQRLTISFLVVMFQFSGLAIIVAVVKDLRPTHKVGFESIIVLTEKASVFLLALFMMAIAAYFTWNFLQYTALLMRVGL